MNDLQFKKQLQTSPFQLDDEMLAYVKKHPDLKQMVNNARHFEQQIEHALKVEVPEGLEARILLKQSYYANNTTVERLEYSENTGSEKISPPLASTQSKHWKNWSAMAASFLVVAIGVSLWQERAALFPLKATDVIAHVMHHMEDDPDFMVVNAPPKSDQELHKLFLAVGASIEHPMEQMSYAGECIINGQKGLHIVLQEEDGPVTIIVMPGQQLAAMEAFQASGYQGELLPVKGGVVAIMGKGRKQVALAHMRFFKAVKFV